MKHLLYIFIATALCACTKSQENCNESVLDIIANAKYGSTHAASTWAGRTWEFFGMPGDSSFQALTTNISINDYDSIARLIESELGKSTYNKIDFPKELIPGADTGVFWMAWKDNDMFYYWCSDTLVVGFSLSDSNPNGIGYSYLYIDLAPNIPYLGWEKGPYEKYIDSLRTTTNEIKLWDRRWFNNERHYKFVNDIYYADSYEVYFGLLSEFLPLPLPSNATEYDRYLNSKIQIDSLLAFEGYFGSTADSYWYKAYEDNYTYWNIQKFSDIYKQAGLYSADVDSAWQRYTRALLTAVDSVVMERPKCQGTISGLEYLQFAGLLERNNFFSMMDVLYAKQRNIQHTSISNEVIAIAFKELKSHLKEHVSKEGFEDIDECYVPLSERYVAIDRDEACWNALIKARDCFSQSLDRKLSRAYDNATNNLKRDKLWLLKNQYRCYSFVEASFQTVFLEYNCSDKELMKYDFQESYKTVYGEYKEFY